MNMFTLRNRLHLFFRRPLGLLAILLLALSVVAFSAPNLKLDHHHEDEIGVQVGAVTDTSDISYVDSSTASMDDGLNHVHDLCHTVLAMPVYDASATGLNLPSTAPVDRFADLILSHPQYPPYRPPIA